MKGLANNAHRHETCLVTIIALINKKLVALVKEKNKKV